MKYLPSPRSITAYGLYGDDGKPVAIIEFEPSANYIELIRLIASAPALLEACEAARRYVGELMVNEDNYRPVVDVLHQLDAAIAAVKEE